MKTILTLILMITAGIAAAMPQDSVGTKNLNGQRYLLHKVSKGEGVYSISKKYGVSAAEVFAANEGSEKTIKIGQVLMIPRGKVSSKSTANASSNTTKTEKLYHVVAKGQTLSSIAKTYSISIVKIKELNNLSSDNIRLGQKLVVGEIKSKTTTPTPPVKQKEVAPEEEIVESPNNDVTDPTDPIKEKQDKVVPIPDKVEDKKMSDQPGQVHTTYSTDDGDEVTENGIAMISSEGDLGQERSFVLHPTAKIGTIIMITNPVNNQAVFARVVGNCKVENGCVLKMSKTVAMKLGVSENTEVKISYAK